MSRMHTISSFKTENINRISKQQCVEKTNNAKLIVQQCVVILMGLMCVLYKRTQRTIMVHVQYEVTAIEKNMRIRLKD